MTALDVSDCYEQYRENETREMTRELGGVLPWRGWSFGSLIYAITFKEWFKKQSILKAFKALVLCIYFETSVEAWNVDGSGSLVCPGHPARLHPI